MQVVKKKKEVSLKEPLGEMLQLPSKRKTPVDFQHVVLGEDLTRQGKARPGEVRQGKARHSKTRQSKARLGKARQGSEARRGGPSSPADSERQPWAGALPRLQLGLPTAEAWF